MTDWDDPKAQKRMQVILEHFSGRLNASEAARELEISRKTFYEWLERARSGLLQALRDRPGGRPTTPVDPEKQRLVGEVKNLVKERAVLAARLRIQEVVRDVLKEKAAEPAPKKKASGAKG